MSLEFKAAKKEVEQKEGPTFTYNDSKIRCIPRAQLPGVVLADLLDPGLPIVVRCLRFMRDIVLPEDKEIMERELRRTDVTTDNELITEMATQLMMEYTGRPLVQPNPSGTGSSTNGAGQKDTAPSVA